MKNEKYLILIADDEKEIRDILTLLLNGEGYELLKAENGQEAVDMASEDIDLYILDVNMPQLSGFMAGAEIRKSYDAPIIFLTAYSGESDKVMGFSVGADDYIVKPFSNMELLMRVKAVLRRYGRTSGFGKQENTVNQNKIYDANQNEKYGANMGNGSSSDTYSSGINNADVNSLGTNISGINSFHANGNQIAISDVVLDLDSQSVIKEGRSIPLTYTEFKILELLAAHKKKIYSLDNIYQSIWEEEAVGDSAIMVHMKNIRKKLGDNSRSPKYIKTAWGRGYYIDG